MWTRFSFFGAVPAFAILSIGACTDRAASERATDRPSTDLPAPTHTPVPGGGPSTAAQFPTASAHAGAALTYRIIDAPNGTFGYAILSDGELLIQQTNMPGQPGVEGCRTKADAEKLAELVIGKIRHGEMPPTVSNEELKNLGLKL
ncbi:MAG: DUF4907 domain-containing protein [Flavobacteriales bacterium]|nr:DUF4907 domain-containing protein [Flavobacteriales bacterium]MBK9074836.1 DUF4907 domain-containing protein [Flavobacteriales bacterium]MBK9538852.1 DUF4907 domain-containing protein [Flavobacteriales bacterium]